MPQDLCARCALVGTATSSVGNVTSHGGPVMHSVTNYAIFWLPSGYHFDSPSIDHPYANASDASYEGLVGQYLRDLSNTAYYSIVQQYTDASGGPGFATPFGGSWLDTSPYPGSEGTRANPLQDSDIEAEVTKAMSANGWSAGNGNNEFFVFTGENVFGCAGDTCSYNGYCAYHSAFEASNGEDVIYADIPDPGNANTGSCLATTATGAAAPNGAAFADSAVNLVAHEGFEAVTDPVFNGWYYQDTDHEIADECVWRFGTVAGDGSNILLNGDKYLVQEMWSNKAGGCFLPAAVPTLKVVANYQALGGGSGFTPPTFTYFSGGVLENTLLSTTPQNLNVDSGSVWNVTGTLGGSTSSERWQVVQTTSGTLRFAETFEFDYYHQYKVGFGFDVTGGGSGYSAPSVEVTQLGAPESATASPSGAGQGVWADARSSYNYTSQLPGSSSDEKMDCSYDERERRLPGLCDAAILPPVLRPGLLRWWGRRVLAAGPRLLFSWEDARHLVRPIASGGLARRGRRVLGHEPPSRVDGHAAMVRPPQQRYGLLRRSPRARVRPAIPALGLRRVRHVHHPAVSDRRRVLRLGVLCHGLHG